MRPQEQETHAPIIFDPRHQISNRHSKLWQVLRPGQLKLLPITHVYTMCMGNCGVSWIFQWRWQQWADGRRTLLGTYAFRGRYGHFICVLPCCSCFSFATSLMKLYLALTGRLLDGLVYWKHSCVSYCPPCHAHPCVYGELEPSISP